MTGSSWLSTNLYSVTAYVYLSIDFLLTEEKKKKKYFTSHLNICNESGVCIRMFIQPSYAKVVVERSN